MSNELTAIKSRYERRKSLPSSRYSLLNADVYMAEQEKERELIQWIIDFDVKPIAEKRVLEIGCGYGDNLLQFLRLGFSPDNLVANELIEDRALAARRRLPSSISILIGDASQLALPVASFDIVLQSTVFSSILDTAFQLRLASHMWRLVRQGGGVLWYDLFRDNPNNRDVRGVSIKRIHELFPEATLYARRVTLAPPISRAVTRVHPSLYRLFRAAPFLRTHLFCWIGKPRS